MEYTALRVGTSLLMGTYRIMRVLGQGGFGITYLAHDTKLDKLVAIKEFFPESLCSRDGDTSHITVGTQSAAATVSDLKERFLKEARNIARLNHPYIIKIYAAFEENNTAYYVMEYVEGESLAQKVEAGGPLPIPMATRYVRMVGEALEYLHSNHMTHLDVKPANIMVRNSDDTPVLIDFGLSKNYTATGTATTRRGALGVSPGFSPSEQYMLSGNASFSPQSDLYSLAATYYYLLTGVTPSEAPMNDASQMYFPPTVSPQIREAIIKAMSMMPAARYQTVREFLLHIADAGNVRTGSQPTILNQPVKQGAPRTVRVDAYPGGKPVSPTGISSSGISGSGRKNTKMPVVIIMGIAGVILIVLMAIFVFSGSEEKEAEFLGDNQLQTEQAPPEDSEYGPFASRQSLINYLERYYEIAGNREIDPSFYADKIETNFGIKVEYTRDKYVSDMWDYWNQQHFEFGTYDFEWGDMSASRMVSGGVKVNYSFLYTMATRRDDGETLMRQFRCTTEMHIDSARQITYIYERTKKLDEWLFN